MVELNAIEKEIWDRLKGGIHDGFIKKADLKKVKNKKKLLQDLKTRKYGVDLQYRIKLKHPIQMLSEHPEGSDPASHAAYMLHENDGMDLILTWTGKWE